MRAVAVVIAIVASVLLLGGCGVKTFHVNRDISAVKTRAQVAADREDMILYLNNLKANMEDRGMTHGHAALVFKTPKNDLALTYESFNRILERLNSLEGVEKNSATYQVALDDIRGTLREIPLSAEEYSWARFGWIFVLVTGLIWVVVGIVWYLADPYRRY